MPRGVRTTPKGQISLYMEVDELSALRKLAFDKEISINELVMSVVRVRLLKQPRKPKARKKAA